VRACKAGVASDLRLILGEYDFARADEINRCEIWASSCFNSCQR
jgi:hypothetical protein